MSLWTELPSTSSWNLLLGNAIEFATREPGVQALEWEEKLGHTYRIQGPLLQYLLYTTDVVALRHVLSHPEIFQKPPDYRSHLGKLLGEGVLVAEGESHKRQRRVLNPAFAASVVRKDYVPVFFDKGQLLVNTIDSMLSLPASTDTGLTNTSDDSAMKVSLSGGQRIDLYSLISHTTLDIIGTAGLGYEFDNLGLDLRKAQKKARRNHISVQSRHTASERGAAEGTDEEVSDTGSISDRGEDSDEEEEEENELAKAYRLMVPAEPKVTMMSVATYLLKGNTPTSITTVNRIGASIIEAKKEAYRNGDNNLEGIEGKRANLLQLIINANMDPDLPERERLSDEEVLGNLTTLLFAGHDTSSSALSWMLYELAQNQDLQQGLRDELMSVQDDTPSPDIVEALPLLDAFLKESLRIHPPVSATTRWTAEDATMPLENPVNGKKGEMASVFVPKGTKIIIPIITVNKSQAVWGADAQMFRPSRWLDEAGQKSNPWQKPVPGIFQNLLTFNGGPSACIGVRFATTEMKIVLFTLLRKFSFAECEPRIQIRSREVIVARPTFEGKIQLPLVVSRLHSPA